MAERSRIIKSEFILSQPPDLHAADVVVNARDAGLTIDLPLVYRVRARANARGTATTRSAETSAPTPTSSPTAKSLIATGASKADFVRAGTNPSSKKIVEQAKPAGNNRQVDSVHNVPRAATANRRLGPKKPSPGVVAKPKAPSIGSTSDEEELLKIIAAEVGLGRAIDVLKAERARVAAIFDR